MEDLAIPTKAYDLLNADEKEAANNYLLWVRSEIERTGGRFAHALEWPIPSDMVRRSKGLLNRPIVKAALAEALKTLSNEQDLSPQRLLNDIGAVADGNLYDFIKFGAFGDWTFNLENLTRSQMASIKTIKNIPTMYGNRTEITLHDKNPAQRMLAEMMGLINREGGTPPPLLPPAPQKRQIAVGDANAEKRYQALLEHKRQ